MECDGDWKFGLSQSQTGNSSNWRRMIPAEDYQLIKSQLMTLQTFTIPRLIYSKCRFFRCNPLDAIQLQFPFRS